MKLRTLSLRNYRCFEEASFGFSEHFTLVSGRNGAGKSALLEAAATALGLWVGGFGVPARGLVARDARRGEVLGAEGLPEGEFPVEIACEAAVGDEELAWRRGLWRRGEEVVAQEEGDALGEVLERFLGGEEEGRAVDLPVLAYYGDAWGVVGEVVAPADARFGAYVNCLGLGAIEGEVVARLSGLARSREEDAAAREELEAIEVALRECVGDSDPVRVEVIGDALCVGVGKEAPMEWAQRGGAFRRVAALFADLAGRCFRLNPHHGKDAAARAEGVVLIDAIETQLHPRWQRYVIHDLRKVFPGVQFVATTNSPFVLQSLYEGDLIDLDGNRPCEFPDLSIEDITEQVLGIAVPQRSKRYMDMQAAALAVMKIVREGAGADPVEKRRLKDKMNELMMPFSNNQAFHAVLMMERIEAGFEDDEEVVG